VLTPRPYAVNLPDAAVSRELLDSVGAFYRNMDLLKGHVAREDIVAAQFAQFWKS